MLKFDERLYEILLVCDYKGQIKKVVYNSLKLDIFPIIGQSIIKLADKNSKANILNCIHTTIDFHQSNQCEIDLVIGKKRYLMIIAAKRLDSNNLLVGMLSTLKAMDMYDDMMKINNESINEIRKLAKEKGNPNQNRSKNIKNKDTTQENLNGLSMANYLDIINEDKENKKDFVELLTPYMNIANYFGAHKNIKVKLLSDKVIPCINVDESVIDKVFNSLISFILKNTICDSDIEISVTQWQKSIILKIVFKIERKVESIIKDKKYLFIQDVIESHKGMIWYEEENDKIKIYVIER